MIVQWGHRWVNGLYLVGAALALFVSTSFVQAQTTSTYRVIDSGEDREALLQREVKDLRRTLETTQARLDELLNEVQTLRRATASEATPPAAPSEPVEPAVRQADTDTKLDQLLDDLAAQRRALAHEMQLAAEQRQRIDAGYRELHDREFALTTLDLQDKPLDLKLPEPLVNREPASSESAVTFTRAQTTEPVARYAGPQPASYVVYPQVWQGRWYSTDRRCRHGYYRYGSCGCFGSYRHYPRVIVYPRHRRPVPYCGHRHHRFGWSIRVSTDNVRVRVGGCRW